MKSFMNSLVANEALRQRLGDDILGGSFSHAYILEGRKGSGRHTIAYLAAAALACEQKKQDGVPLPCMTCPACRKILSKLSPDVILVGTEDKASIGVDAIRFLREDVPLVPNDLDNKIYIIENADKMTVQAQNAFLLTLEEPPEYVGFILLCEDASYMLETIRSRAPILRTEPISRKLIDEYIQKNNRRASSMKANSPSDYEELLMASDSAIGRALELLDTKSLTPVLTARALAKDFISAAIEQNSSASLSLASRFSQKRDILSNELDLISLALRDLAMLKKSENAPLCFYSSREDALDICEQISIGRIMKLCSAVSLISDRINRNANVKLTIISLLSEADML